MSTFGSILSIARSAIHAHQTAIQVASNNVANAETPGYTRQRAELVPSYPVRTPIAVLGSGVRVADVGQIRDTLLDASFRRESTQAAGHGLHRDLLGQLEGVFGEPSDAGFASTLDAFWGGWSDLANAPTNDAAREVVKQRGGQVAMALNGFSRRLDELSADTGLRLGESVARLNAYATQVAQLNTQIVSLEVGGTTAGGLRDARNTILDAMATLADVQVHESATGGVAVTVQGQTIVDGSAARALAHSGSPPSVRVTFAGSTERLPALGGELGAMLEVLNVDVPATRTRLDELAGGVVSAVNAAHRAGWSPSAEPVAAGTVPVAPAAWSGSGVDFFDPAGVSAATISLSAAVQGDRGMIAAGGVYGGTGDNAVARSLAALRDTGVAMGAGAPTTLGAHYADTVTGVALRTSAAESSATVYETLAAQTDVRRQGVSGVSTDEELIALMRHQQAYVAATRLVTAADEMAQAILGMV